MTITARRGEYRMVEVEAERQVAAHPRGRGVTFSPSASTSRFGVTDSGRRYEVRLRNGIVQINSGDSGWQGLRAAIGADSEPSQPWGLSYLRSRTGKRLEPVPFDMIAVGRGRILAKEEGKDRFYHVQIDELFRTRPQSRRPKRGRAELPPPDPVVPANYFKLYPDFFTPADGSAFPIPPELEADYSGHPASLRFPLFVESMRAETSDGMVVPVHSGVWHLIDSRSPLIVFDLDDLKWIGDTELREVATRDRIRQILGQIYEGKRGAIEAGIAKNIRDVVDVGAVPDMPLPEPVDRLLDELGAMFRQIGRTIAWMEGNPVFGMGFREIDDQLKAARDALASFPRQAVAAMEDLAARQLAGAATGISRALFPTLLDAVAREARAAIRQDGFAALYYPGIAVLALLVKDLQDKGALKIVPSRATPGPAAAGAERSELRLHIGKTVAALLQDQDSPALRQLVQDLVEAGRRKRGVTIPNAPPESLPSYVHVRYEASPGSEVHERRSIAFRRVLDLGVGYSHWHEHWQADYGGEMHSLMARRPLFQQERYNLIQYRFLNGPVVDGDGYNDGTTNFYMLVEMDRAEPPVRPDRGAKGRPAPARPGIAGSAYAILWIDEQTYFSQRWRLLHPTIDTAGDLFSIQRTLRDNPEYFRFDLACYWSPFEHGCIDGSSRMAVARQIVAVTGRQSRDGIPEIYTICFNYGVCDYSWRWRAMPSSPEYRLLDQAIVGNDGSLPGGDGECLYTNTLGLREDSTLHLRGRKRTIDGGPIVEGRWVQKYLPADARHVPERFDLRPDRRPTAGFDHPWDFVSEEAFQRADQFYLFGVYERTADARCQYYEIDILPDEQGVVPSLESITGRIWRNASFEESGIPPLSIDTINFNWELPRDEAGYLELNRLTEDRGLRPSMSMYESTTRFRLLERKGKGMIAVLFDKRDDELQSASHLPQDALLIGDAPVPRGGAKARPSRSNAPRLRVRFRANRRVLRPPMVQVAAVEPIREDGRITGLTLSFWTHQSDDEVRENLWRFSLAALDRLDDPVMILSGEVFGQFVRQDVPEHPLPLDFALADLLRSERQFVHRRTGVDQATADLIARYCTPAGRVAHATSLWFEDVVGHMSPPESLRFQVA